MNEFDLIQTYFNQQQAADTTLICGIGDDAAVINPPSGKQLITCCDTLIEGVHFPKSTSAFAIGYKSVAVNLSDLAAMGATPHSILLALSLPQDKKQNESFLQEFAKGLNHCCAQFGVKLIGGDTTKSDTLSISITAMGFAERCVYRSGAQVGDVIAVTGHLGDAAFALTDVLAGKPNPLQHRLDMPTPRVGLGQALAGLVTSMIDVSDGLLQDFGHICKQSGVGAHITLENLPISSQLSQLEDTERFHLQLTGGDDYELLFTLPRNAQLPASDIPMTVIGEVVAGSGISLYHHGELYTAINDGQAKGFQHF